MAEPSLYERLGGVFAIAAVVGGGTRLFEDLGGRRIELQRTSTVDTPGATHLRFDLVG